MCTTNNLIKKIQWKYEVHNNRSYIKVDKPKIKQHVVIDITAYVMNTTLSLMLTVKWFRKSEQHGPTTIGGNLCNLPK
jgi:hypothetical protein